MRQHARVPMDAIKRFKEVGGVPFVLYAYYLGRARRGPSGRPETFVSIRTAAEDLGLHRQTVWEHHKTLVAAGWIEAADEDGVIRIKDFDCKENPYKPDEGLQGKSLQPVRKILTTCKENPYEKPKKTVRNRKQTKDLQADSETLSVNLTVNLSEDTDVSSKNGGPSKKTRPKKGPIPDPFMLTSEMRSWAKESCPRIPVAAVTKEFVEYWRARADLKTGWKTDWVKTWKNRLLFLEGREEMKERNGELKKQSAGHKPSAQSARIAGQNEVYDRLNGINPLDVWK